MENVTRRSFVQGAAVAGMAAATLGASAVRADEAASAAEAAAPAVFAGGRRRPEPHTGHPTPQTCGYVGPDAMPIAPVSAPEAWDIEADVVIVGTGMGGLTASTVASQAGFKTVIVEKNPLHRRCLGPLGHQRGPRRR